MIIGIDIGGSRARVASIDVFPNVTNKLVSSTGIGSDPEEVMLSIERMIRSTQRSCGDTDIEGIGISLASPVNPQTGMMVNPPNLPEWDNFAVSEYLDQRYSVPIKIGNDASLAALAEYRLRPHDQVRNLIYYTLSTGIGGGIIVNGQLYMGEHGFAGELGHLTVDIEGPKCNCGNMGCLEAVASGLAIAQLAKEGIDVGKASALREAIKGREPTSQDVFRMARVGDEFCSDIVDSVARYIGAGMVSAIHIFDPELIIVGGGMSGSFDQLRPGVEEYIRGNAMGHFSSNLKIEVSNLGDDGGLLGAACLFYDEFTHTCGSHG